MAIRKYSITTWQTIFTYLRTSLNFVGMAGCFRITKFELLLVNAFIYLDQRFTMVRMGV